MKLRIVLDQLTYGELSQLALVDQSTGQIPTSKYPMVVAHINLGLTDLFKRFKLKEGRTWVALQPGQVLYRAKSPDVLKIEQVFSDKGVPFPMNDSTNKYSVVTPSLTTMQLHPDVVSKAAGLPDEYKTDRVEVTFRANHRQLVATIDEEIDPDEVELELPMSHLQALLLFVASRVHNPIGMTGEFNAGNNYAAKYEAEVASLMMGGLQLETQNENTKFERNGWC